MGLLHYTVYLLMPQLSLLLIMPSYKEVIHMSTDGHWSPIKILTRLGVKALLSQTATTLLKPKFHYTDFATFTETLLQGKSWTQIMKLHDTNHVADFHDLCCGLT